MNLTATTVQARRRAAASRKVRTGRNLSQLLGGVVRRANLYSVPGRELVTLDVSATDSSGTMIVVA